MICALINNYFSFYWVIVSYVLGSFPSGYIFTKLSVNKDILQIGWRKSSGSNVFKNIGIWQGALTAVFDVGKGYLAVYLAQYFGLPAYLQALSGVAAVIGHNWSCFLKFSGGRGIGTLAGAFLALSPELVWLPVIILIILAVIWNASIGTIVFLITSLVLAAQYSQLETIGVLILGSLIPIFIKRLSPISEIKSAQNKFLLIRNRLIFDDDKPSGLRIKRIIKGSGWW
ncbi:MAG: glycerol-3-phosphate acyltransferase [Candidatus Nealsonbacteria bacterium]